MRVGWVTGLNRLYFLFEASENCGDFSRPDLHNDTFEIVIDGDASDGPLTQRPHPHKATLPAADAYFPFHGVHAQDYPFFTRFVGKDWGLAWGSQSWIKAPRDRTPRKSSISNPATPAATLSNFGSRPSTTSAPGAPSAPSHPSSAKTNSSASAEP